MGRVARSFKLVEASWEVLKADREIMLLPLMSFASMLVVLLVFGGVAVGTGAFDHRQLTASGYVALGLLYLAVSFIGIFFNAAVVGAANIRLSGGDPTVADGLRAARSKAGKIFSWAMVTATVGLILRTIEQKVGLVGRIVVALIGAAWSIVTFFVVPILLFEDLGVADSIKRSGTLFRERWGEEFTGNVSIGLAIFLVFLPVAVVSLVLTLALPPVGILVGFVGIGLVATAGSAMTGIFNAALYRYATAGDASGPFDSDQLREAFRQKRRVRGRRPAGPADPAAG